MKLFQSSLIAAAAVALISGCASSVKLDDPPVETRTATPANTAANSGANSAGAAESQVTSVDLSKSAADAALAGTAKIIYFDFDSFVVRGEYKPTIEANAKVLSLDAKRHLVVEGHTDDRGGREYNLALGQKRAEAVVKSLQLLGAKDAQLEAVSFGKERPAVQGNDEAAYAKNRRAELVYR